MRPRALLAAATLRSSPHCAIPLIFDARLTVVVEDDSSPRHSGIS